MIQMMRGWMFPLAFLALLLPGMPSDALAQDLALLRVESLENVRADAQAMAGDQEVRLEMLEGVLGLFGLGDSSQLDEGRPMALVLPMQGMMLAQRGLVAALPVTDTGAALDSMAGSFAGHSVEDDGLQVFTSEEGMSLFVRPKEGYLILGGARELVTGFDAEAALARSEGPPGNTRLELFLEPAAPMIKMGLMGARQQVLAQMQQKAAEGGGELPIDPARMGPILDLYFGLIHSLLDNVSRVQLALEVRDGHLLVHERFQPRTGSTLEGVVAAQKAAPSGLPTLARLVSPDAVMVSVGDMEMTPAAVAALRDFVTGYLDAVAPIAADLLAGIAEGDAPAPSLDPFLAEIKRQLDRLLRCAGRESVASFDFAPGESVSFFQAYEWSDAEGCRVDLGEEVARAAKLFEGLPLLAEFASFTEGPPVAGTATATTTVQIGAIIRKLGLDEPQALQVVEGIYGKALTVREAYAKGSYFVAGGADADARLASLLAPGAKAKGGGLTADAFLPLLPGGSSYFRLDLGRLLSRIREALPPEAQEDEKLAILVDSLAGPAGRIPLGFRFDPGGATLQAALPLDTVRLFLGLHERMQQAGKSCPSSTQDCVDAMSARAKRVGLIGLEGVYDEGIGGYRVDSFIAGNHAEAAGVRKGDVLVKVNGIALSDGQAARADEPNRAPGMTVELTLLRGGEEIVLGVELFEKPADILAREIGEHLREGHAGR